MIKLHLGVVAYTPLKGSSYLKLPKELGYKKAILNLQNEDNKCFMWSVLAAVHPVHWKEKPNRLTNYKRYEQELNFNGIVREPKPDRQRESVWI